MKEVILTVGPRASGKSSFCERVVAVDSDIVLISRDNLIIELCGKTDLDPYSDGHRNALGMMWKMLEENLRTNSRTRIILDTWNGSSGDRTSIISRLDKLGASRISAWYFTTSIEYVSEWFWQKPGIAKMSEMRTRQHENLSFFREDEVRRSYELFHQLAKKIDRDGFHEVTRLDPLVDAPETMICSRTGP
ncbi:MAG: AAA family ATPase [Candidatus Doudnabacteria bacterium]|nr:AAA family ATPase [Candidatus Doudnabacteria bacterium]